MGQETEQTTTETVTKTQEPERIAPGFFEDMTGKKLSETTTSTTTPPPEDTDQTTTDQTTTDQTTTKAPEQSDDGKPKIRRAKGFEDVPELVSGLKDAAKALTDATTAASASRQNKPAEKPEDDFQYTDEEKEQLGVLEQMVEMFPNRYPKDLAERARTLIKTVEGEEARLLKEKPDISDEELDDAMAEYRKKLGVQWSDADFRKAEIRREVKPIMEEKENLKKTVERIETEDRQHKLEPVARKRAAEVVREDVLSELGEEYKNLVTEDGEIDKEAEKTLSESDPLIADAVIGTVQAANEFARAAVTVFNGGQSEHVNHVVAWAKRAEAVYSQLPKEQQLNEKGQQFVPRQVWNQMTPKQRESHWVVGPEEIIPLFNDDRVKSTKSYIDKIKQRDEKKFPKPAAPPKTVEKPISPSSVNTPPPVTPPKQSSAFFEEMKNGTLRV